VRLDILTLFPEIALAPLDESIIRRARQAGIAEVHAHNLRDWTTDKHRKTDDYLCGGGQGMLLKPEPIFAAVEELRTPHSKVILMTPQGRVFKQALARELSAESHLILICGHYEGVDHRVIDSLVDLELSIGDYVLTNGAIAAAVVCDAIIRLLPGALGDERSPEDESFTDPNLLEAPAYTKPVDFRGMQVPEILLSGHHAKINEWKRNKPSPAPRKTAPTCSTTEPPSFPMRPLALLLPFSQFAVNTARGLEKTYLPHPDKPIPVDLAPLRQFNPLPGTRLPLQHDPPIPLPHHEPGQQFSPASLP
jgi:tRNA (guanine37-N1)-methyltransferase